MKQKRLKEVRETTRNEVASQYKRRIELLQERISALSKHNKELELGIIHEQKLRLEAENKIEQYEDWIERLQNFCNLSDEDRPAAIEAYKKQKEEEKNFNILRQKANQLFGNFINII